MRTPPALLLLCLLLSGCGSGGGDGGATPDPPVDPADATVTIDNRADAVLAAPAVNRRLLGSNVQWTGGCDGLLVADDTAFATVPLATAAEVAPTVIRFPGGGLADAYRWQQGEGPAGSRGTSINVFTNASETIWFGTGEFLSLCQQVGAEPLITLNTVTASTSDSSAWVTRVNGDPGAGPVPLCRDWEVGNEPYLENTSQPSYNRTASQFAADYDAHAAAVIAADNRIHVGLPLMGPVTAALVATERRTWNADVLDAITQRVDFVAVHDAYLPFYYSHAGIPADDVMLSSLLASAPAVDADLTALRTQLAGHGVTAPFAMTEHNALMTVFGTFSPIPRSDGIPSSVAAAIYTADLLCVLAKRDDVDSAEHWSLISNWMFGAMDYLGNLRPSGRALEGIAQAFAGRRLPVATACPTSDVPAFGALPAQTGVPLVGAFSATHAGMLRTVLVNRSPTRAMRVRLACRGGATAGATVTVRTLNAADPLQEWFAAAGSPEWVQTTLTAATDGCTVDLPAHALVIVAIPVAEPSGALEPAIGLRQGPAAGRLSAAAGAGRRSAYSR